MAWVLGISLSHNGSACLMCDGEIIVAIQEERVTRIKRDAIALDRESHAVSYCLDAAGITPRDLDMVVLCSQSEADHTAPSVLLDTQLVVGSNKIAVRTVGHHLGHLMSALALSGHTSCAGLVMDGMGSSIRSLSQEEQRVSRAFSPEDSECVSLYNVINGVVHPIEKLTAPHDVWLGPPRETIRQYASIGGMYAATAELIFGDLSKSGHVMGLAALGQPTIPVDQFLKLSEDCFVYADALEDLCRGIGPWPKDAERCQDLAASVQAALEFAVLHLAEKLWKITRNPNLCFSGGVALNALINERLIRETPFQNVFVPSAAEDSGPAIGAAFWGGRLIGRQSMNRRATTDTFGRSYTTHDIASAIERLPGLSSKTLGAEVYSETARRLSEGQICGWFQGGSEFGPRALGNRSILADPRPPESKDRLNRRVKHREDFRPFAPAVLRECADEWFETATPNDTSEFMLRIWRLRTEKVDLAAGIRHTDGSARPQTVDAMGAPDFHRLISAFHGLTGVPVLVNTSFNVNGEPIVETPEDALWCFLFTDLDFCVLRDWMVERKTGRAMLWDMRPRLSPEVERCLAAGSVLTPLGFNHEMRWGMREQALPGGVRPLLRDVDGVRSIRQLADAFAGSGLVPADDEYFLKFFARMRRMGAVDFAESTNEPPDYRVP